MARILLATVGSLGDIHPFIAIGRALKDQGHRVTLAAPENGLAKARAAGLEARPFLPDNATILARLGMSEEEMAAAVLADTNFVIDEILMPCLRSSTAALDALAADADVMCGSIFALATDIVAEKRGLPLATLVLQPMTLFSVWQPPEAPRFAAMRHAPKSVVGRGWNRGFYALVRAVLRQRHARGVNAVRAEHGLGPISGAPVLDHGGASAATLCCWSTALGTLPPDAPANAVLTGFPFFDSEHGVDQALPDELAAFLRDGPPPLVFTLGSFAIAAAGDFYREAMLASRALGRRALMLTGQAGPAHRDSDCLFMGYAPHSAVFPQAAAIVHHGGIGTTGQALRAGRPQVVVPHFADQFDNAARLRAGGTALTIRRDRFRGDHAAAVVGAALELRAIAATANDAARTIAGEDGAAVAARHIAALCP